MGPWLVLLSAVLAGCQPKAEFGRVRGKVLLNGKTLTSGVVTTLPAAGPGATGTIESDGSFELRTRGKKNGVSVGSHKVAVVAYESSGNGPEAAGGKLLVPKRYSSPETSGLEMEVQPGENYIDIPLTSP